MNIELSLIGIGTGHPDHITRQGVAALNRAQLILVPLKGEDKAELAGQLDAAIREQNQDLAAAIVHRYGEQGHDAAGVTDVLLKYAISEDGALHAEKYFRTTTDEFANSRAAFRWRQLVALARVTASECGQKAPGYDEACKLLGVA